MSFLTSLIAASFLTELCIGQSITAAPTASCNYCFLAPGFTETSSFSADYLLFTAYSMTSAFAQDGSCVTVSGASIPLQTPYSVLKPATATANPAQFSSAVATWFVSYLDVTNWGVCGEDGELDVHMADAGTTAFVNVAVPTVLGVAERTSSLEMSSTVTTVVTQTSRPTQAEGGLSTGEKAAIGVASAIVGLVLLVPGLLLWIRYRKQRAAMMERKIEEKLDTETDAETGFSGGL